ncbi:ankyrin repeat domain-containing 33B [Pelobates cultripes]|uniref:Ankyrin repeat domain-containing 33B n=1 Tax=Pelobates cultripes TaxID=61616 RepID=A0AAD1W217_PELCU|nr:ankyrin repeat domain-containing 33B [Pelobates cultripes]
MVLLSGARNVGGESRGGKGKGDLHPIEEGGTESNLGNGATELGADGEFITPENELDTLGGTANPLPQLLAVVPSLEERIKRRRNEDEEYEEYDDFSDLPDTRSIASDDSFYPPEPETCGRWMCSDEVEDGEDDSSLGLDDDSFQSWESTESPETLTLFKACSTNNAIVVRALMRQGLNEEEVQETDQNHRTGLLVACYQGYVDIVIALSQCPHVDVNWQDNDGNTALITATQAGHITITNYLLNYYPGLDLEKRNIHGFTALMKASIQGRTECVRALMLAGADINAVDPNREYTSMQWARFTGRFETVYLMQKLLDKPSPEQFCDLFKMEWPKMKELLAKAAEPKSCAQKISDCIKSTFSFNYFNEPMEDGVLDHMVRITTSMNSPFVAIACQTVCPGSPPCVGKRRYSVQEITERQRAQEIKASDQNRKESYEKLFKASRISVIPPKKERRASLQISVSQKTNSLGNRRTSLLPLNLLRRSSVRPGYIIPKVRISKAPAPTYYPEKLHRRHSTDSNTLQIPKWRYKELKEQRKKAEEEERCKAEEAEKQRQLQRSRIKKRTFT